MNDRVVRGAAVALALAVTSGCDLMPSPTDIHLDGEFLGVHAVLRAGAPDAAVVVTWSQAQPGASEVFVRPGTGAELWLVDETAADSVRLPAAGPDASCWDTVWFGIPEVQDLSPGCYRGAVPGGIRAGASYRLRLVVGGREVTGRVVVPPAPAVEGSFAGDTLSTGGWDGSRQTPPDAVLVRWRTTSASSRVEIRFVPQRADCRAAIMLAGSDVGTTHLSVMGADSARVASIGLECSTGTGAAVLAYVQVAVTDSAYARYYRENVERGGSSVSAASASAGLHGAYGVFGAVAQAGLPVYLRAERE